MRRMLRYQSGAPISHWTTGRFCNYCPSGAPDSMSSASPSFSISRSICLRRYTLSENAEAVVSLTSAPSLPAIENPNTRLLRIS